MMTHTDFVEHVLGATGFDPDVGAGEHVFQYDVSSERRHCCVAVSFREPRFRE
jgi:hypothetical protein